MSKKNTLGYKEKIDDLLSNYVEGKNVFINATDWDDHLRIKPESVGKPIPTQWLALAEEVIGIIAHDKYGLKTYPNVINVIDAKQMLSAYASVGMPVSYDHWSFGKELIASEQAYAKGRMGLAYEIVINSDPSIAFCMAQNSKTMQLLVIAHASFGHNSFFCNNHLFKQFTSAKDIIGELDHLQHYIKECEEKHGVAAVESLLDAAHALQSHGVNRYSKPRRRTPEEERERRQRIQEAREHNYDEVMDRTTSAHKSPEGAFNKLGKKSKYEDLGAEENLLYLISSLAPHLQDWQRQLLKMVSDKAQYFYPQRQTQLMNEGWATFWHHTLMNDLYDMDLISDGMMLEFVGSHCSVVQQSGYDSRGFGGLNPYALGFAMYKDIQRICTKPTEEDKEWFPAFAGNQDWLGTIKEAAEGYKDESFVAQFLSPHIMREFRLFSLEDNPNDPTLSIRAIHNDAGYKTLREDLAAQYRLGDREPQIEAMSYFFSHDRSLILQHTQNNERPLHNSNARKVLQHIHALWKHPVVLQTVSPEGEIIGIMACPKISRQIEKGSGKVQLVPA